MVRLLAEVLILAVIVMGVVAAVGSGGSQIARAAAPRKQTHPRLSRVEVISLSVLALTALVVAIGLANRVGDAWWLLPVVTWFVVYLAVRAWSRERALRRLDAERQKRQQEAARDRQRLEEFGREGVSLLKRANNAIKKIVSTEAARTGWLGEPAELDFRAELATIEETLRKATAIQKVMAEASTIPNPTKDDVQLVKDAKRTLKQLDGSVREQVNLLSKCSDEAIELDRMLRDDREQSRIALQRGDVRARLSALIYGAELTSAGAPSDAVDAVSARVDAFRELRALMARDQPDDRIAAETEKDSSAGQSLSNGFRQSVDKVFRYIRR